MCVHCTCVCVCVCDGERHTLSLSFTHRDRDGRVVDGSRGRPSLTPVRNGTDHWSANENIRRENLPQPSTLFPFPNDIEGERETGAEGVERRGEGERRGEERKRGGEERETGGEGKWREE